MVFMPMPPKDPSDPSYAKVFRYVTWPCGDEVVSKWYGHPTCRIALGGRARNDLGDKIAMWFVEKASIIGYALPS